jgi:hypothetical protein
MSEKHLHIISFDIPYPPNYGGVIDVYYKLKILHKLGIKLHLHCFEYPGRDRSARLKEYCVEVHYYERKTGFLSALSLKPYIVSSRRSEELISNLLKDDHPILFEGLHSCYYINDPRIAERMKIYRESNIEHRYYFNLFKVDKNLRNKLYFLLASGKLLIYQSILRHADLMLVVSKHDTEYLQRRFPEKKVVHLPSFHANDDVTSPQGKGTYALYHGNIEVPENEHAARFLVNEVFTNPKMPLIIAGMNPRETFCKMAENNPIVQLKANPSDEEMFSLIRNAHVNILVTFQATGLKLKLLNTLYRGRFCLVNEAMITGTGLASLCEVGNTADELKTRLKMLFQRDYDQRENEKRIAVLQENYDNLINGERLIELIFDS